MSQGELARVVGVTRPAVSKWENGDTENLKLSNIVKLCQIFRLSADELIGGDLALERPTGTRRHAINEPAAAYRAPQPYRMPDRLAKSYADLNGFFSPALVTMVAATRISNYSYITAARHTNHGSHAMNRTLIVKHTKDRYGAPLACVHNLPGDGAEFSAAQLRRLAATLLIIADETDKRGERVLSEVRTYCLDEVAA